MSDVEKRWKYRFTSRSCILWGVFLVLFSGMRVPSGSSRIPLIISLMCVYNCPILLYGSNLLCVLFFQIVRLRLMWLSSYPYLNAGAPLLFVPGSYQSVLCKLWGSYYKGFYAQRLLCPVMGWDLLGALTSALGYCLA